MDKYSYRKLSSLVKVFSDEEPIYQPECSKLSALRDETVSFQVAYSATNSYMKFGRVTVKSPISEFVRIRQVVEVPCRYAAHKEYDEGYLRTTPGLYPDLLSDLDGGRIEFVAGQWRSLWIDVEVTDKTPAGEFPITLIFTGFEDEEEQFGEVTQNITIYDVTLPKQKLIHTEWFHADCLAQYYGVEIFSERHWEIMENFIDLAVKRGCNMILTPQFTPPLDTAKGGERLTTQLVDISLDKGVYSFNFDRLERFINMNKKLGMEYFEMSHLFSQWGATSAPKVMVTVDGEYKHLFGWHTNAVCKEYTEFLHAYLPELIKKIKEWGIADKTYFHVSDEPKLDQLDSYKAAKESVADLLKDFVLMDALSDYDFYKTGAVECPVPANNHIKPFIENDVKNLWVYYCTGQYIDVSNRFFALPSLRNRIYGLQLFKYDIVGILHWGYNFYNSMYSVYQINPYLETSSASTFPGGDPFLVYPKADGTPEESIRIMVHKQAIDDVRALNMLADKIGKDAVMNLIEGDLDEPLTFDVFPKTDSYLINLRNTINKMLSE